MLAPPQFGQTVKAGRDGEVPPAENDRYVAFRPSQTLSPSEIFRMKLVFWSKNALWLPTLAADLFVRLRANKVRRLVGKPSYG